MYSHGDFVCACRLVHYKVDKMWRDKSWQLNSSCSKINTN